MKFCVGRLDFRRGFRYACEAGNGWAAQVARQRALCPTIADNAFIPKSRNEGNAKASAGLGGTMRDSAPKRIPFPPHRLVFSISLLASPQGVCLAPALARPLALRRVRQNPQPITFHPSHFPSSRGWVPFQGGGAGSVRLQITKRPRSPLLSRPVRPVSPRHPPPSVLRHPLSSGLLPAFNRPCNPRTREAVQPASRATEKGVAPPQCRAATPPARPPLHGRVAPRPPHSRLSADSAVESNAARAERGSPCRQQPCPPQQASCRSRRVDRKSTSQSVRRPPSLPPRSAVAAPSSPFAVPSVPYPLPYSPNGKVVPATFHLPRKTPARFPFEKRDEATNGNRL